ncbi:cyclic nucleotide-binding domain-containing protein [Zoogloea sp.]|jgi:CRP/FNR family cyclic AMP-dependent transcriptional regulator|uniref:cyclic nucleotide-binding domain-containing protein n=1 Tax=Zoogloea sp. TaxID=49181 RepID=UPI0011D55E99|nr:cyclic nucleotide-binding domain-containing protein [Zoogloea sp.]MBK6654743.1 cyclic nucleotide-binding domain-containing protein [Zoogloea sp.]MBP7445666.1 cyclic nucleotide-binding domain-containing protein [Zoogloea sp.]TXG97050.1 MAG: cyclic nucleotide-binding domain-containing protein [Zoogloea sp.]HPI60978.1 cyclic nucleotide-binding domain-containing protein [Zoogloea sp.]
MVFFELFSNAPDIIKVNAGAALFREGEDGTTLYVLTIGTAEVMIGNRVVETLQPGNIIGEMALVDPAPRAASVIAVTDCEFVEVDDKRFNYLVQQTPFFALKVMRVLSERLRTTSAMLPILEDV